MALTAKYRGTPTPSATHPTTAGETHDQRLTVAPAAVSHTQAASLTRPPASRQASCATRASTARLAKRAQIAPRERLQRQGVVLVEGCTGCTGPVAGRTIGSMAQV